MPHLTISCDVGVSGWLYQTIKAFLLSVSKSSSIYLVGLLWGIDSLTHRYSMNVLLWLIHSFNKWVSAGSRIFLVFRDIFEEQRYIRTLPSKCFHFNGGAGTRQINSQLSKKAPDNKCAAENYSRLGFCWTLMSSYSQTMKSDC